MTATPPDITPPRSVAIVGAGLLGASIGLALRAQGVMARLWDSDPERLALAVEIGAGEAAPELATGSGDDSGANGPIETGQGEWTGGIRRADLLIAAVPPSVVTDVLLEAQRRNLAATFIDIASVKSRPLAEMQTRGADLTRYCGTHPVAGAERSGPVAARADLFEGRAWVLTPTPETSPEALAAAEWLVQASRATPVRMDAASHDDLLARLSHVPQLVASSLALELLDVEPAEASLAGPGLRDVLRIAGSSPAMWAQIATQNAAAVAAALRRVIGSLATVATALEDVGRNPDSAAAAVEALVAGGNAGYARLPGKHGGVPRRFVTLPVVVRDAPGELARLLADAAAADVNVEDIRVEHAPGQPVGVVEIAVAPEAARSARAALRTHGWRLLDT